MTFELKKIIKNTNVFSIVLERKYELTVVLNLNSKIMSNSYLCIKGIIRRIWHAGIFKARGTRAFEFPRAIIDNYARGAYNVLFYFIISKRFKQIFSIP
jgi:hypothetical protein